ncbi:hypothetical protein [Lysobacter enzymogenes]|uniref:hypothetical protein n=1 Tax=Lysobacter enzymogenes TaxID=69 RepID=UPI001A96B758|nr:hypothetical protein [Lysobacter enzymogenes]QQP95253.1 hypothetical protein JHW38_18720 [Lysobacter enzymogenes]
MQANKWVVLGALLSLSALSHSPPAQAGNVSNAVVTCYIETADWDVPQPQRCEAYWIPSRATNPSTAYFEVTGLQPGRYSIAWRNVEINQPMPSCANSNYCWISIATETRGDGKAILGATVTDLDTGESKSVQATARYYDGVN